MPEDPIPQFFDGNNTEALRRLGYDFVDLIVDLVLSGGERPFVKDASPFTCVVPDRGTSWQDLRLELETQLLPRALNLHNPRYMGHMDSVPLAVTIWADALTAALNNNMLSYELSPVFTQLEAQLITWFARQFGLGESSFGTLTAGGSLANMTALLLARHRCQPATQQQGARGGTGRLTAFLSEAAHTSFDKGMNVVGLGRENLVKIPTNTRGEMDVAALERAIQTTKGIPFFVGAIAGTTITGAIDNIPAVAAIAQRYGCWFHLDAAYGGAAALSPTWKSLLAGSHLADSITCNPQKWLWVSRTCAMLLVRDKEELTRGFDQQLPYMDEGLNFGNLSLEGTRRTDSLKLWLALRSLGLEGYAQLIDRTMSRAQAFRQWVEESSEVSLVCEPTVNIVCLRSRRTEVSNAALRQRWMEEGKLWLSLPQWHGERILKAVLLHPDSSWHSG